MRSGEITELVNLSDVVGGALTRPNSKYARCRMRSVRHHNGRKTTHAMILCVAFYWVLRDLVPNTNTSYYPQHQTVMVSLTADAYASNVTKLLDAAVLQPLIYLND